MRLSKSKPPLGTSGTETLFVLSATEKTFSSSAQGPPGAPADWVPATKQQGTHALHSHKHQRTLLTNTRMGIRCEAFFFFFSPPLCNTKQQKLHIHKGAASPFEQTDADDSPQLRGNAVALPGKNLTLNE